MTAPETPKNKNPWIAGFLSFLVPALGHFYAGHLKKALGIYASVFLLLMVGRFLGFVFLVYAATIILLVLLRLYAIIDAVLLVVRNKVRRLPDFHKWWLYLVIAMVHHGAVGVTTMAVIDNFAINQFANLPTAVMEPTIRVNEKFAFSKTKNINRNDIMIFMWPGNPETWYVFRCVAQPGDELELKNGRAFVNGSLIDDENALTFGYFVFPSEGSLSARDFQNLGIEDYFPTYNNGYNVHITNQQLEALKAQKFIGEIKEMNLTPEMPMDIYSYSGAGWGLRNYGPIYIPKKGESITLNPNLLKLYGDYILDENANLSIENGQLMRNNSPLTEYTFTRDYYFAMGDNRDNSLDSRKWGLIPDELILGKARYILWSDDRSRIGKSLD